MSLLPDSSYLFQSTECSSCRRQLTIQDEAIYYDAAKPPLLLGMCCAETVISALYMDFARTLDIDDIYPSPWIRTGDPKQRADAAKKLYECYDRRAKRKAAK